MPAMGSRVPPVDQTQALALPSFGGLGRALSLPSPDGVSLVAGFLLEYHGRTRAAYLADLKDFWAWCEVTERHPWAARRVDIDAYVEHLRVQGRSPATVAR